MATNKLRIIPLGGLGEVGKNMMALEYGRNILVIDAGLMFPENDMLGIDIVIPDFSYLLDKKDIVRGIVITHGHQDHIGGLPYLLSEINVPLYATELTRGLIEVNLRRKMRENTDLNTIKAGDEINIGPFEIEFFHVSHSIPDCVGLAISTPAGLVVHSGDFKFDHTPVDGRATDFSKLAELGRRDVLLLMSDSTNAEEQGMTVSEQAITETFDRIFSQAKGRVLVATFASLISRIQQVIDMAAHHGRQVALAGTSLHDNVKMALELGYLQADKEVLLLGENAWKKIPPDRLVLMVTGSQGEPQSALVRMSCNRHPSINIKAGDTVVLSSHTIPGNEEAVNRSVDRLFRLGAHVIYDKMARVHVSGHGGQEDQKLLIRLVSPKYFVPIHGEYRHLALHAQTAQVVGIPEDHIFVIENGQVIELDGEKAELAERIPGGYVFVDGSSVGDVGRAVIRDREILAEDGFVVAVIRIDQRGKLVGNPRLISRGFVYMRESQELIDAAEERISAALRKVNQDSNNKKKNDKYYDAIRDELEKFFYAQTRRRPMVMPVIISE